MRKDDRRDDQIRPITVVRPFTTTAPGSVFIQAGETKVLCTATWTDTLPPFLVGQGSGWVTAEYGMLPGSTQNRKQRESRMGRADGRTMEIQRLIGRSLRAVLDLKQLPERSFWLDCDVLSADGGTRTLAITGAWMALHDCLSRLRERGKLPRWPLRTSVAAVSAGVVDGRVLLDLDYEEDARAEADLALIMTGDGELVGIQGGGESRPITDAELSAMLELGRKGCMELAAQQHRELGLGDGGRRRG